MDRRERTVAATKLEEAAYPTDPPFHPGTAFPEYDADETALDENPVYRGVRRCFAVAGLDADQYGDSAWNPLGELLKPDDDVVLKPNFVKESHPRDPAGWRYVLTHGSVIRAVADYVFAALGDDGRVVVADAPHTDASFDAVCDRLGLYDVAEYYQSRGLAFHLTDLRKEEWETDDGVVLSRRDLEGDPKGYSEFDLGDASEFADHGGEGHYYGADFDKEQVNSHHTGGSHEYLLASTAIDADVVFSLPKLKTHKKAGITVTLKNLVGINGDKNYLPHHTEPGGDHPGDEHPDPGLLHKIEQRVAPLFIWTASKFPTAGSRLLLYAKKLGKPLFGGTDEVIRQGNWHGNDTVWRMCLDLNKLLFYGNTDGTIRTDDPDQRKRHYSLVDGVVAGEGRGPMNPDPVPAGLLLFGTHPASVDAAAAWMMGFDPDRIPIVRQAFNCSQYPLAEWDWRDVLVNSDREEWDRSLVEIRDESTFSFEPHFGWEGHVERSTRDDESPRMSAPDD